MWLGCVRCRMLRLIMFCVRLLLWLMRVCWLFEVVWVVGKSGEWEFRDSWYGVGYV